MSEKRKLFFEDETTFQLLPCVQRTYSPKGCTPTIETKLISLSCVRAAVAISPQGDLFYEVRKCAFTSPAMARFLTNMPQKWKKNLLIIWDGATIHTSHYIRDWLKKQSDAKIWLARFPPYSPELNPAELIWGYMKNVLLDNICCKTVKELKIRVIEAFETLKSDPELIQLFFCHKKVGFYN